MVLFELRYSAWKEFYSTPKERHKGVVSHQQTSVFVLNLFLIDQRRWRVQSRDDFAPPANRKEGFYKELSTGWYEKCFVNQSREPTTLFAFSKACILENESEDRFEGSTEQLLRGLWSCQI
jgi:hypothetical protein